MTTLTRRLRAVQPAPVGKLKIEWLVERKNSNGTSRWYFMPHWRDRANGWHAVRLHDKYQRPITDPLEAAAACNAVAAIYEGWRKGRPDMGVHRIDRLGRVVEPRVKGQHKAKDAASRNFKPGQIGAMVHDYKLHEVYLSLGDRSRSEYATYLNLLVDQFGDRDWRRLSQGEARSWIAARAVTAPSGAHALYRTCRAFFGKIRLVYSDVDHPGIVREHENPFAALDLGLPTAAVILWPREAVEAFVKLADAQGQPSIGDALLTMSWLGIRKQDWLAWPANVFDGELLAFQQEKTDRPLVIPWTLAPPLVERVTEARRRRTADAVTASTFFHDPAGRPWGKPGRFREAFNKLRDLLEKEHPHFATRYYVGLDAAHPLRLPTSELTVRTLRHTCITLLHDAGVPRDLIPSISGHAPKEIDAILAHYHARTADQAAAALNMRVAHEANGRAK